MTPKWLYFNGAPVQNPDDEAWSEDYGIIEDEHETEAGTTIYNVTRYDKLKASGTWTVSESRKREFEQYARSGEISVQIRHHKDIGDQQITRRCVLRNLKTSMIGYRMGKAYFKLTMDILEI
ncbi:MAG: hypothetical protein IJ225_10515 [Solobacterium sp.]|nr:hypothetical protein [Solobacterium sp.]